MASITSIPSEKLARLIGTPKCPALVDLRSDAEFDSDPRLIPGSTRVSCIDVANRAPSFARRPVIAICHDGGAVSEGVAAMLRAAGVAAENLDGGSERWAAERRPMVPAARLPTRDSHGRTLWVTRARPKIDRIACPWLIRRFVDPDAIFLFVASSEVLNVAARFDATPFDIDADGVFWSHRGPLCTFDVMVEEFGLAIPALARLSTIVRAADTTRLDLAPEASGLFAASLGLSRMYSDDLEQLDAGMLLYDAFFRWCRDAANETHNWPATKIPALA